jgi:hypothetical protein
MRTSLTRRFVFLFLLLALALVGSACTITIGPYDDADGTGPQNTSALPAPKNGPADEPLLDAAQQARKEEADWYVANVVYKGGEVLHAIQLPSGDVLDFIKRDTLPAFPDELPALPDELSALPFAPEDLVLPEGVELGLTELEQIPELLELAATATPFHRPTFWPYILGDAPDATSIEDYLARYQEGGQPSSGRRLYAGLASLEWNRGVSGYMNQFRPEVEPDSFSLIEFTVFCPAEGPAQEQIGIVISVDKRNAFGMDQKKHLDDDPRLHIEYARPVNGHVQYIWDEMDGAFVANPLRLHHPGQKVPVSAPGGARVEHLLAIFQVPWGDWWITYNGNLLGYYPASLFTMLKGGACGSAWYGEVLNRKPGAIETEMGSGEFAEAGLLNAAYVRNPVYFDLSWQQVEPQDDWSMIPYNPLCYDRSSLWNHHMILGGPGGKNPACEW